MLIWGSVHARDGVVLPVQSALNNQYASTADECCSQCAQQAQGESNLLNQCNIWNWYAVECGDA